MKNIYILSTDKPSVLGRFIDTNNLFLRVSNDIPRGENVNIYITSDEEIKEGDVVKIPCGVGKVKELSWKFGNNNPSYIVEDIFIYKLRYGQKEGELQINSFRYEDVKKIILTTDQDLIEDGVQEIDDEFLEWFVKNPSCEKVEVKHKEIIQYGNMSMYDHNGDGSHYFCKNCEVETSRSKEELLKFGVEYYKIIIPKEEPKQEMLEEAAEKFRSNNPGTMQGGNNTKILNAFKNGAKWQQERMYSEEEVGELLYNVIGEYGKHYGIMIDGKMLNDLFEQFKKK